MKHNSAVILAPSSRPPLQLAYSRYAKNQAGETSSPGIESRDAAAALGLDPLKSQLQLWVEKSGRQGALAPTDTLSDSEPSYWPRILETLVAAHYTRRTGNRVRRVGTVARHPSEPWMLMEGGTEVVGDTQVQLLECRAPGIGEAGLWHAGIPRHVHLQVMHKLAVSGVQASDLAVLLGGQHYEIFRIERDEQLIAQLVLLERDFWEFVLTKREPPANAAAFAARAISRLYPHESAGEAGLADQLPRIARSSSV